MKGLAVKLGLYPTGVIIVVVVLVVLVNSSSNSKSTNSGNYRNRIKNEDYDNDRRKHLLSVY